MSIAFPDLLKSHLAAWAPTAGLGDTVEPGRPWVLRPGETRRNLFRPEWATFIAGREHKWARALNSSQCFAVNLFSPLADDRDGARRFLRKLLLERTVEDGDVVRTDFERCPEGVAERVGERGQPTQIDVLFCVFRARKLHGAVGIEVKLSEREFGGCRGFNGERDGRVTNPDRSRCLDGRSVFADPLACCFMAEAEGRRYWSWMTIPGASFDRARLAELDRCAFRHGLYQLMRNRVALDVLRSLHGAEWCELVACPHARNELAPMLPEPVAGHADARDAFDAVTRPGALLRWDALQVVEAIEAVGAAPDGWERWMREKYLLDPDAKALATALPPRPRAETAALRGAVGTPRS